MTDRNEIMKVSVIFVLYIVCLALMYHISADYEEGILYNDTKPYICGVSISVTFFSVISRLSKIVILGCAMTILTIIYIFKGRLKTSREIRGAFVIFVIIDILAIAYIIWVVNTYDPVIYNGGTPFHYINGGEVELLQVIAIPSCSLVIGLILSVIFAIMSMGRRCDSSLK